MRSDVKKELIETEMKVVFYAVVAAEGVIRKRLQESADRMGVDPSRVPSGVDLHQIQSELYNPDNGIVLTDLTDTIVRDRLNRLIVDLKLHRWKTGREVIYMTPQTKAAIEDWKTQQAQVRADHEERVVQLSADLGYEVQWFNNTGYRRRKDMVTLLVGDLEEIAEKI